MKTEFHVRYVACSLMVAALLLTSMRAVAEDNTIPFKALMQSASAESTLPSKPDATDASSQNATSKHSDSGRTKRIVGGVLVGGGVAVITATLVVVSLVHGDAGHAGRVWAGVGGGAAMTGAGVALIVLGSQKRPAH